MKFQQFTLIGVFALIAGCGLSGLNELGPDQACNDGWFDKKEEVGSYEALQIPDLRIGLGDTLWFDHNSFWESSEDCDEGYARLDIKWLLSDSDIVVPILSNTEIGLISKSEGVSIVHITGTVKLRRDDQDISRIVTQSFEVEVLDGHQTQQISSYVDPPIFEIEDLIVRKIEGPSLNNLSIEIIPKTSVEETEVNRFFISFTPNSINDIYEDKFLRSTSSSSTPNPEIKWDSSFAAITGLAKLFNPDGIQFTNGIGNYTGRYFEIHSSPIDAPVSDRTFTVKF